ncbi:MAG: methyltransferase [Treponema sp.]|jgi:23S rRNA (uracil1939-C5)-methyltransferase|nr:methyltransferase [Treponema sp.]
MIHGEIFTAPVECIAPGGAGMLTYQGQRVFMEYTAPGDLVTGRICEEHTSWAQAALVEILEPSPHRVPPLCSCYGSCGGCSLQHLAYHAQIAEKGHILQDTFTRIGGLSVLPELCQSPSFEYRNRMQLHYTTPVNHFAGPHRPPRFHKVPVTGSLGLKARNSETIIPIQDCPIADPGIRLALGQNSLVPPPEKDRFTVYARLNTFLSEGGKSRGRVRIRDRDIHLDAGVFFQSNGIMLEMLIGDLLGLAGEADTSRPMADLYCGVGTFAAFLRDHFSRIDLVEADREALNVARENVQGPGIRYTALSCDRWIQTRAARAGLQRGPGGYGFMVVDPPRQGLSTVLRHWLSAEGPPILAYISCDPATLARDSRELCTGGYRLETLKGYDFYPQTAHIETLAVFRRPEQ